MLSFLCCLSILFALYILFSISLLVYVYCLGSLFLKAFSTLVKKLFSTLSIFCHFSLNPLDLKEEKTMQHL